MFAFFLRCINKTPSSLFLDVPTLLGYSLQLGAVPRIRRDTPFALGSLKDLQHLFVRLENYLSRLLPRLDEPRFESVLKLYNRDDR